MVDTGRGGGGGGVTMALVLLMCTLVLLWDGRDQTLYYLCAIYIYMNTFFHLLSMYADLLF
jgi:hypothetical protein